MPAAEDAFIDLMKEADAAAWRKSNALPSKITTSIYYTARKAIVTAPSKGASFLASHIPIVGAIAAFGVGKLTDKIRKARVAAKVFAAEGRDREEVSPQDVKALAKAISDRAKKMDENFTKLSDAWERCAPPPPAWIRWHARPEPPLKLGLRRSGMPRMLTAGWITTMSSSPR